MLAKAACAGGRVDVKQATLSQDCLLARATRGSIRLVDRAHSPAPNKKAAGISGGLDGISDPSILSAVN
jgi:hypothetical protein